MAVKTWEEIYGSLSADEKKLIDNLDAKEPELKKGWLRQDEYSRQMNKLKAQETEAQEAIEYKARMEPWAAGAYEKIQNLKEAEVLDDDENIIWIDKKTQLEKELADARAAAVAGGDMKPEELTQRVKEIIKDSGERLSKEEIAALMTSEGKKMVEEGFKEREAKFNSETIPMVAGFSAAVAVVSSRYERETGEKWTAEKQKEMFELMSKEGKYDAFAVEEKLLEPAKRKKADEDRILVEAERIAKEKYGVPGDGSGGRFIPQNANEPKGALQQALDVSKAELSVEDRVRAGAVEGAKELIAAGKF